MKFKHKKCLVDFLNTLVFFFELLNDYLNNLIVIVPTKQIKTKNYIMLFCEKREKLKKKPSLIIFYLS